MRSFLVHALLPSPAVGAALAAFFATLARPNNPDTLWHLALGRWILGHHSIPDVSSLYYSATAGFGYDYSWLSQAALFGAFHLLGGAGIAILSAVVAGFIFYLLYKLLERNSANLLVNFILLGLAFAAVSVHLSGRPVMFTVAFFTLEVLVLSGYVEGSGRGMGPKRGMGRMGRMGRGAGIWLIPPMVAIWANVHPGFAVAPLLILLFLPMVKVTRYRWTLAACLAVTMVAVGLNPYGWRMYLMPLDIARALPMLRGLSEWAGVSGWEAVGWGCLVALVTLGLALRRQPASIVLLAGLAALAAGASNRNMSLFGVVAVFVLGRTLVPALAPVLGRAKFVRRFDVGIEHTGGWFWAAVVPLLLAGAVRLGFSPVNLEFDFSGYPVAAVRHIEARGYPGNLFVRETWSGYLLWAMPDRKLFYDAKGGFGREAIQAHSELIKPKADWRRVVDRYGLSTLLLERGSPLAVVLGEAADWRRVYSDSLAEVFVRGQEPVSGLGLSIGRATEER